MIINLIIIFIGIYLSYIAYRIQNNRPFFYFFSVLTLLWLSFISGVRDLDVGYDVMYYGFPTYQDAVYSDHILQFYEAMGSTEYIFSTIMYIGAHTVKNFNFALGIVSLCTVGSGYLAALKLKSFVPFWITFSIYLLFMYSGTFNLMRQFLAVSMCLYAYSILRTDGLKLSFFIVALLAVLAHNTAIMAVLVLVFYNYIPSFTTKQFRTIFIVFILGNILVLGSIGSILSSMEDISGHEYSTYLDNQQDAGWAASVVPYTYIIYIFIYWSVTRWALKRNVIDKACYRYCLCSSILSIVCFILGALYAGSMLRMAIYFLIWTAFDICYVIYRIKLVYHKKKGLIFLLFVMFVFIFFRSFDIGTAYSSKILDIENKEYQKLKN